MNKFLERILIRQGWFKDTDGTWYHPFPNDEGEPGMWLDAEREAKKQMVRGLLQMAFGITLIVIGVKMGRNN